MAQLVGVPQNAQEALAIAPRAYKEHAQRRGDSFDGPTTQLLRYIVRRGSWRVLPFPGRVDAPWTVSTVMNGRPSKRHEPSAARAAEGALTSPTNWVRFLRCGVSERVSHSISEISQPTTRARVRAELWSVASITDFQGFRRAGRRSCRRLVKLITDIAGRTKSVLAAQGATIEAARAARPGKLVSQWWLGGKALATQTAKQLRNCNAYQHDPRSHQRTFPAVREVIASIVEVSEVATAIARRWKNSLLRHRIAASVQTVTVATPNTLPRPCRRYRRFRKAPIGKR